MECKLCNEDKRLIDAHVIPKSFHRISPDDKTPSRLLTNVEGRYNQRIPKGVYDKTLVCEECEATFSSWDKYADQLFLKSWDKFQPLNYGGKTEGFKIDSFDYKKLKLFFMSLLWRASASSHPVYEKVDLGPKEDVLKKAILDSDAGDLDFFGVVLQAFDTVEVGFLDPHPERFGKLRFYRFYLNHIIAYIKVDSLPFDDPFRSIAIGSSEELILTGKKYHDSEEYRIMRDLVRNSKK